MLDAKLETFMTVAEKQNFTRAAEALSLTQPAVSQHIQRLEAELGTALFLRNKSALKLTKEGEIALKYARRFKALYAKMRSELETAEKSPAHLRVGITHTAESNLTAEALAKCGSLSPKLNITIITDTIKNLYDMLDNYEIDLAIVEGTVRNPSLSSVMLDTDYLVCAMANENPLSRRAVVTLTELKKQRMILRLPTSATRMLFESTLESSGDSIENFNVAIEVDNIATIKDLIRKNLGVSILPKSACMDELRKGKITALPIENLTMARETKLVYKKDFARPDILQEITRMYQETARQYR